MINCDKMRDPSWVNTTLLQNRNNLKHSNSFCSCFVTINERYTYFSVYIVSRTSLCTRNVAYRNNSPYESNISWTLKNVH